MAIKDKLLSKLRLYLSPNFDFIIERSLSLHAALKYNHITI